MGYLNNLATKMVFTHTLILISNKNNRAKQSRKTSLLKYQRRF